MPYKNNTREGIHSGLSSGKEDEKWSDMLNFRSGHNRTVVVPRRCKLLETDAGFHTVLHGVGFKNYAFGSKQSFVFHGHDETSFEKLWRLKVSQSVGEERTQEALRVRGSFLGDKPAKLRVTLVRGRLVLDTNVPPAPVEVTPDPVKISINCGKTRKDVVFTITTLDTDFSVPLVDMPFIVYRGVTVMHEGVTNGNGVAKLTLAPETYTIVAIPDGFTEQTHVVTIADEDVQLDLEFARTATRIIASRLPWVVPYYSYKGYMVLEFYNSTTEETQTIHSFEVQAQVPESFDFAPYSFGTVPAGFDRWRLRETSYGTIYYNELIGE